MAIYVPQIIDNLQSTSKVDGLSANQGRILTEEHGVLGDLSTIAKENLVAAINEIKEAEKRIESELDTINGEVI